MNVLSFGIFEAKFQKLIKDVKDYIKSLVEIMQTAEDLESLENLHALCSLMQTIRALFIFSSSYLPLIIHLSVMLNDHTMYEHILEDDIFFRCRRHVRMYDIPFNTKMTTLHVSSIR